MLQGNLVASLVALSFAVIGIASATPLFFTLVSEYLSAGAAAGGIALISTLGNLGPAVTPSINGFIVKTTGDNAYSMYFVIALYLLSELILLLSDPAGFDRSSCQHERELTKTCRTGSGSAQGFDDKRPRPMGDFDA